MMLTKKIILAMAGTLLVFALQATAMFPVYAAEKKTTPKQEREKTTGDTPTVKDKQCSAVSGGGESVHFGKCGNVCKGKEVQKDHVGKVGPPGGLFCEQ